MKRENKGWNESLSLHPDWMDRENRRKFKDDERKVTWRDRRGYEDQKKGNEGLNENLSLPPEWMDRENRRDDWRNNPARISEFEAKRISNIQKVHHVQFESDDEGIESMIEIEIIQNCGNSL